MAEIADLSTTASPPTSLPAAPFAPPVTDEEFLLRQHFSPESTENGKIKVKAISLTDLSSRGYSLHREATANVDLMHKLADDQAARKPEDREDRFLSRFQCQSVRALVDDDGNPAFDVDEAPLEGNLAHTVILSALDRKKSELRAIRLLLVPILETELVKLADYKPPQAATASIVT